MSRSELIQPAYAYGIAKQTNHIRVRAASTAWGERGARINSISPGIVSTPMGQHELASPFGDGMRTMIAASATKRAGTPDDIASAAAFLLGPDATFITGTDVLVDGGVTAALQTSVSAVPNKNAMLQERDPEPPLAARIIRRRGCLLPSVCNWRKLLVRRLRRTTKGSHEHSQLPDTHCRT